MSDVTTADRTLVRQRPHGLPVMHQTWDKLLFLHWPVEKEQLRRLVPAGLEIDAWEGTAWIGVTPFTIRGIRPPLLPPLPMISNSHELNVRTYVQKDGVPGVWFLSLDASNALAVLGARIGFSLPYFRAEMELTMHGNRIDFRSARTHSSAAPAEFQATWQVGSPQPDAVPGTRDFFLIERYCLYASTGDRLYRAQIHHRPWPLCTASVDRLASNVIQSHGLPEPRGAPLVHAQSEPLQVWTWRPKRID